MGVLSVMGVLGKFLVDQYCASVEKKGISVRALELD